MKTKLTKNILVTGVAGFIGFSLALKLLKQKHMVVGIDNLSKYGKLVRSFSEDKKYKFIQNDVKDKDLLLKEMSDCDYLIAGAAMIGGISYFHDYAYDLLSVL